MPRKPAPTQFVVHRLNWRYNGRWHLQPGLLRVGAFASRAEAEADCARREANARRRVNPFGESPLSAMTSMPEGVFFDLLADLGATPPEEKKGKRDWRAWWGTLRDDQRAGLMGAMDLLRFYEVVERPAVPVAYCATGMHEFWNGEHQEINCEGGKILGVWRSHAKALERADGWHVSFKVNPSFWFPSSVDPFDPEAHYRRFIEDPWDADVLEIELHQATAKESGKCHVIARRTWERNHYHYPNDEEHVPVAAYTDRDEAEARRTELEDEARLRFDVFDLFHRFDVFDLFHRYEHDDEWEEREEEAALRAAIARLGLPFDTEGIGSWLARHKGELTPEQRAAIVRGVPSWRIYDIVETDLRD